MKQLVTSRHLSPVRRCEQEKCRRTDNVALRAAFRLPAEFVRDLVLVAPNAGEKIGGRVWYTNPGPLNWHLRPQILARYPAGSW